MKQMDLLENNNLKVLGMIVRVKRNKMGYSLRDLAQLTNISHTLISNFEQGKLVPNQETIKDIFKELDLEFHTDIEISKQFEVLYHQAFKHILYYEYGEAQKIIDQIDQNLNVYENSVEAVNVAIIRCLFFAISNIYFADFDRILAQYEIVLNYLSPSQKQLFYFIKGLDFVNKEYYYDARINFELALSMGDKELDFLIKEYYVISLSKANKYVDAGIVARECITHFEEQTNYIRAMRLRTRIAYDLFRINKFEESRELYLKVLGFAKRYQVQDLMDRCHTRLSLLSMLKSDYQMAEYYLDKVTVGYNRLYHYLKFDIVFHKQNDEEALALYEKYINLDWVQGSLKTKLFFELILMRYDQKYMDKTKFEDNLIQLISMGHQADDGEMIEVSCNMLSTFYQKERRYKAAYEISQTLLNYNKNGILHSEYDPSSVTRFYKE